jgi:DNA-binding CsgD family transcriptional regulator
MPGSEGELAGRTPELSRLGHARRRAARGPVVVELVGEPGIGKSSVLGVLVEQVRSDGGLALCGRAAESEREIPYAPLVDALAAHLPAACLTDVSRPHAAVRSMLELLAAERPVVLAIDDLHWADPASVELLVELLQAPPRAPVLLVLARRRLPRQERLASALATATASGPVERVELRPLDDAAAARLVAPCVRLIQGRDALVRRCGGNPFHLLQLPRHGGSVPEAVADLVLEEVEQLDQEARRLLQGAAVVGDPFDLDLAAVAAGGPVPPPVDELVEAGLVRPSDALRAFRFRHPLVRRIIRDHTGPGWSARAHGRVAGALRRAGAPPVALARHVARSARAGDRPSAGLLIRAAGDVAARAPADAAQWYADALRLLPRAAPVERVVLLTPRALALETAGRHEAARAAFQEILGLVAADRPAARDPLVPRRSAPGRRGSVRAPEVVRTALRPRVRRVLGPPRRRRVRDELTDRERAVAALVAEGRTNREIGAALHLAEKTVERHVSRVLGKLGARTRAAVGGLLVPSRGGGPVVSAAQGHRIGVIPDGRPAGAGSGFRWPALRGCAGRSEPRRGGLGTMVGREVEQAFADVIVAEVAAGSSRALAVCGEPGIGKSLLLEHLAASAEAAGFLVVVGRVGRDGQAPPFAEPSAGGAPQLVVLDDVHRADPATVRLVDHMLRHPPGARVLLGMALRPRYAPRALLRALRAAERSGTLATVELGPLPADHADALLGGSVPEPERALIRAESGGNPFYLHELARWPAEASAGPDGLGPRAPGGIVASLREELGALPASAARLLSAAALVGDPFDIGRAAASAALPEGEALDLLDELCRHDLVRATEIPRCFTFRHPVLRRAAYSSALPGRRADARARTVPGEPDSTGVGGRKRQGPEAARLLVAALDALPDADSATATRLRLAIGAAHLWWADHEQARHWASLARAAAGRDPVLRGAAAALLAGVARRTGSVAETGAAAAEAAALLDPLPDDALTTHIDSLLLLGWSETTIERPNTACVHLRRALDLAERAGQVHLLPEARSALAVALTWTGALADAARAGDEAIACSRSTGAADSRLRALWSRCTTAIVAGDLPVAARLCRRARGLPGTTPEIAATTAEVRLVAGDHDAGMTALRDAGGGAELPRIARSHRPYWFALLAEAEIHSGRRADAMAWAERAEEAAAGLGLAGRTGWALRAVAAVRNAHREHARAACLALRSAELLDGAGNPVEAARSRTLAGIALGAAGQRSRAAAELGAAAEVLARCGAAGLGAQAVALLRGIRSGGAGSTARDVLSPREHQIALLVATGRTNREIAEELMLSVKTVETHLGRAFGKLGVPTRSALAAQVRAGI